MKLIYTLFLLFVLQCSAQAQNNPTLTVVYEKESNSIKMRWQHYDDRITSYVVQRSSDNIFFTDLNTKKISVADNGTLLKYTDEKPSSEKNYYRLKIFRGNTSYEATLPVMVISGNTETGWVVYPIPVSTVLHLQYKGNNAIKGVISLNITCVNSGQVFNRMRVSSNSRIIDVPVDNLGKGVYDIRVYVGNEIVWNQRFIK